MTSVCCAIELGFGVSPTHRFKTVHVCASVRQSLIILISLLLNIQNEKN